MTPAAPSNRTGMVPARNRTTATVAHITWREP